MPLPSYSFRSKSKPLLQCCKHRPGIRSYIFHSPSHTRFACPSNDLLRSVLGQVLALFFFFLFFFFFFFFHSQFYSALFTSLAPQRGERVIFSPRIHRSKKKLPEENLLLAFHARFHYLLGLKLRKLTTPGQYQVSTRQ